MSSLSVEPYNELIKELEELLRITELVALSGQNETMEQDISDYTYLLEKREPLIMHILRLMRMVNLNEEDDESIEKSRKINDLLARVIEVDKKHVDTAQRVLDSIKGQMKSLKSGKKLNAGYASPTDYSEAGRGLDAKQ